MFPCSTKDPRPGSPVTNHHNLSGKELNCFQEGHSTSWRKGTDTTAPVMNHTCYRPATEHPATSSQGQSTSQGIIWAVPHITSIIFLRVARTLPTRADLPAFTRSDWQEHSCVSRMCCDSTIPVKLHSHCKNLFHEWTAGIFTAHFAMQQHLSSDHSANTLCLLFLST